MHKSIRYICGFSYIGKNIVIILELTKILDKKQLIV